jgi:hypothetical protein
MAARVKIPAISASPQPPAAPAGEGRGRLCRVEGYSPARDALLAVYALLPKPMNPPQLERLAGLLSGDARFEAHAILVEELPFPARGHAVVDLREGRLLAAAVPEEVRRRLEEHRARRPTVLLRGYSLEEALPLDILLKLRRLGFGLEARLLRHPLAWNNLLGHAVELRAPRPLPVEERARVRRLLREDGRYGDLLLFSRPREEEALERAGLLALAEIAPSLYWRPWGLRQDGGVSFKGGAVSEEPRAIVLLYAFPSDSLSRPSIFAAKGARGEAYCTREGVYAAARSVDDRFLELAARVREATARFAERYLDWLDLLGALMKAEFRVAPFLSTRAPIANGASPYHWSPGAKVWEEGGKVKAWLSPELKEELERELAEAQWSTLRFLFPEIKPFEGLRGYLRRLSGELGREVELVGEEPPFRFSPEVDAAAEELRRAIRELVGSA